MQRKSPFRGLVLGWAFLFIAGLACTLSAPTPAAWALTPTAQALADTATAFAATRQAADVPLATLTPADTPTFIPETPTTAVNGLLPKGPWLACLTDEGKNLALMNPDGSGRTSVLITPLLDAGDLQDGVYPLGGLLAVRTRLALNDYSLNLDLIHLPDGKIERLTGLLSADLPARAKEAPGSHPEEAIKAVAMPDALRWSPDGRYLAFVAVIDGFSSDLYLYDMQTRKIEQLTSGSNQVATPVWSPDGAWLVVQEVQSFGDGKQWVVNDVWANQITYRQARKLYIPPTGSLGDVILGWTTPQMMLIYSRNLTGGFALRTFDLDKLKANDIYSGSFNEVAYDPKSKTLALVFNETLGVKSEQLPGLYLMSTDETAPRLAQAGDWHNLAWSPGLGLFSANGPQGVLDVALDGTLGMLRDENAAQLSPNKSWQAGFADGSRQNPGVRLYKTGGELMQAISSEATQSLAWQPDSNGFFYLANDKLYLAVFPKFQPQVVDDNVMPGPFTYLGWLNPMRP